MPRINTEPRLIKNPDWNAFQLGMLRNAGYQKVSNATSNTRAVSRLELFFGQRADNWVIAQQLWLLMIGGLSEMSQPLSEEVAQWNEIAQVTDMPIRFDENGLLEPITEEAEA